MKSIISAWSLWRKIELAELYVLKQTVTAFLDNNEENPSRPLVCPVRRTSRSMPSIENALIMRSKKMVPF